MARKSRHRSQGEAEAEVLKGRWSGLRENQRLQSLSCSADELADAHEKCQQLINGELDAVTWESLLGLK